MDRKTKERTPCVYVTCCSTAVFKLETTSFNQHEDLIHVQHNDDTEA